MTAIATQIIQLEDVVDFVDGPRTMNLFGDVVTFSGPMVVNDFDENGNPTIQFDSYGMTFRPEELIVLGNIYDTEYNAEGDEVSKWFPEMDDDSDWDDED